MRVAICGAGAIGASIAYYLARRGIDVTVIERTGIACAASGKSGGFLALDWCAGTALDALARRSFALHARLPGEIGADWGYRRLATYSGIAGTLRGGRRPAGAPGWLADEVAIASRLGTEETTAQVDPAAFTTAMMRAAGAHGARLRLGRVTGLARRAGSVAGVVTDDGTVEADAVVIALGPWSVLAASWLTLPAVFALKGHSLVFATGSEIPATALFLEAREATGAVQSPELFSRADGTTYVCAINSQSALPLDPGTVAPDPGAIERLEALCARLSPALGADRIIARQACHRPATEDGLPLIGRVPGLEGAYVATGHSVWGILNAPATGEAMAELIVDGAPRSTDLAPFDPARLPPLDPARLR